MTTEPLAGLIARAAKLTSAEKVMAEPLEAAVVIRLLKNALETPFTKSVKMLVDADWLRKKVEDDPDMDTEALETLSQSRRPSDDEINHAFDGYGMALRAEGDPPIPGDPLMSMADARRIAKELVERRGLDCALSQSREGWKLVPVEPTEAMILEHVRCAQYFQPHDGVPMNTQAKRAWAAMLSASPSPQPPATPTTCIACGWPYLKGHAADCPAGPNTASSILADDREEITREAVEEIVPITKTEREEAIEALEPFARVVHQWINGGDISFMAAFHAAQVHDIDFRRAAQVLARLRKGGEA